MRDRIWPHAQHSKPSPEPTIVLKSRYILAKISQQSLLRFLGKSNERDFRVGFRRNQGFQEGLVAAYKVEEEMRKKKQRGEREGLGVVTKIKKKRSLSDFTKLPPILSLSLSLFLGGVQLFTHSTNIASRISNLIPHILTRIDDMTLRRLFDPKYVQV